MLSGGKDLEKLLTRLLHPEGFRRKGRYWYLDAPEIVVFVNLQRAPWSETFYLNIGALLKSIRNEPWDVGDRTRPKAGNAHYTIRIEDLFPEKRDQPADGNKREMVQELLDFFGYPFDPVEREEKLSAIFEQHLVPFLRLCKDEAGLRAAIVSVVRNAAGTSGVLRDHLKLPVGWLQPDS